MELSVEKSQEQADIIASINILLHALDIDYCRELVNQLRGQAGRQEGMAVLLPTYPQKGNDLLRTQAKALEYLVNYVESLKGIDELKKELRQDQAQGDQIRQLFVNLQLT